jgi:hypothetical protein
MERMATSFTLTARRAGALGNLSQLFSGGRKACAPLPDMQRTAKQLPNYDR